MTYEERKQKLIRELEQKDGKVGIVKNNSNLFRTRNQTTNKIDVRSFNKVLSINKDQTADVEGMTTFDDFVKATLPHGFMPAVVPQLKTITIGGAVSGVGIESTSFRLGLVHENVNSMEVLTGNGVVQCSPTENADLFYGLPNSYGSLGYILKLNVKLLPVKKYVKVKHRKFTNGEDYFKAIERICKEKHDFVDGTIFSPDEMYITIGHLTDEAKGTSNYKYMNMYYKSIKTKKDDYLTIYDYLWRWDADWFWCSKNFGAQNWLIRLLLGKWLLHSKAYWKIIKWNKKYKFNRFSQRSESVVQDIGIPIRNASRFLDFYKNNINFWPVWICPWLPTDQQFTLFNTPPGIIIDFGFWDSIKTNKDDGYYNKKIEEETEKLEGHKSLYSTAYYTEEKFWQLYAGETYKELKKKFDPDNRFLNLFEKVVLRR